MIHAFGTGRGSIFRSKPYITSSPNSGRNDDTLGSAQRHSSTEDDVYDIQDDETTLQFNVEVEAKEMSALVVSMSSLFAYFFIASIAMPSITWDTWAWK